MIYFIEVIRLYQYWCLGRLPSRLVSGSGLLSGAGAGAGIWSGSGSGMGIGGFGVRISMGIGIGVSIIVGVGVFKEYIVVSKARP